jgi:hypothetical protein
MSRLYSTYRAPSKTRQTGCGAADFSSQEFLRQNAAIAAELDCVVITFSGDSLLVRFDTQKNALNCAEKYSKQ